MFKYYPLSPGPEWEVLQEPEPSSDDELNTEDGDVDTLELAQDRTRARDARTEATRSAAFVSTSRNTITSDNSRSQMKRKSESMFTPTKRARHFQASCSDQDSGMDLDLDEHAKNMDRRMINRKPASEKKTIDGLGGRQPGASQSVSSTTLNRKELSSNDSTSPSTSTSARSNLMRKISAMKPPTFLPKRMVDDNSPATRDPPSKLAELPFDTYKRAERKSVVPASPVDKGKTPIKHERVPSATQTPRRPSTSETKAIPFGAEIIEISDDDSPSPSMSQAKSKSISVPKEPIEVIVVSDSDEEQLPLKAQKKNVGRSSGSHVSQLVEELATGSNSRRGQSRVSPFQPASAVPAVGAAHSDSEDDPFNIPLSPRTSLQEFQVIDDTNDTPATKASIPLPSSIGLSQKDNHISTSTAPMMSIASLSISSPPPQSSTLTSRLDVVRESVTSPSASTSTGSSNNRLGFSPVAIPSWLQAPPPHPGKHLKQLARKLAIKVILDEDEDTEEVNSEPSGRKGTANTKAIKGKAMGIRETSSPGDTEFISMGGLRDTLAMDSDRLKQPRVLPILPKKHGQTLAEAITSAGQLNRTKNRVGRRLQRSMKDVPVTLTSNVEAGVKDATADKTEKALKAAIGSSKFLVSLLKEKSSISTDATAEASSPQENRFPSSQPPSTKLKKSSHPLSKLSPRRKTHDMPSQMLPSSPVGKIFGATNATAQPQREPSTAFEFKSGTAVIGPPKTGPPKRISLPKRPSAAKRERILAAVSESSSASHQTSPAIGFSGESDADVPMAEITSRESMLPMLVNMSTPSPSALVTSPSSIPFPLSPSQTSPPMPTKPFKRTTPPKGSKLAMTETRPLPDERKITSSTSVGCSLHDNASTTIISASKSSSPKLHPASLNGSYNVRAQSLDKQPSLIAPKSPPISAETTSSRPQSTDNIAALEAVHTPNTPHPPAYMVPTSSSNATVKDTPDLPSDDSPDDDEECEALLQPPDDMDVAASHNVQLSLQDGKVVKHNSPINLGTSITLATTEVSHEHVSVSPPIPGVQTRRSSRISSGRSSRSSSSGGLGTTFDYDFGPFEAVPVTRTPTPEIQELSSLLSPPKTYGGFRALTWKDFRKDLNNFTPKTYYAKDLPHALQDHINSMSEYTQKMEGMRDLFKATILENTVEDEPNAPPIEIWNNVDNQSTPPWEFYYTNNMWLGEGVPPPNIKTLVSCNCKGGCNPKSKTCACLLRQREAACDPSLEFAYDKNGKLKVPGYPIFECNDLCGCSDECRNRVVQHGRKVSVSIGKTETKGWGVFAGAKRISEGTYIGIYSGELLTDAEAHERGIKYNKSGRTYLFDIDFHHLKEGNPDWESSFTVDAYHAGNFTRFLNHSCDPNCRLYACYINEGNIQKPLLAIFTRRDIEPYEEICFNYQGIYDDGDDDDDDDDDNDYKILDPDHGKDMIYVHCQCGAKNCTGTMFK